jgi:formate hydrogenlyase transcriptional activator
MDSSSIRRPPVMHARRTCNGLRLFEAAEGRLIGFATRLNRRPVEPRHIATESCCSSGPILGESPVHDPFDQQKRLQQTTCPLYIISVLGRTLCTRRLGIYPMSIPPLDPHAGCEDRLRFEMLLVELSARIVSVSAGTIDEEIVNAQREIVQALDLDRSVLGQLRESGQGFVYTHSWYRPGLEPIPESAAKNLPWLSSIIARGEAVCVASIDEIPEEAVQEREFVRHFGLRSNVTFPLKVGGSVIGAISFGTMHREREWPDTIVNRLRLFVEMIGSALARTRAERATQEAFDEVRRLRDQLQRENVYLQQEVKAIRGHALLIGDSAALRSVLEQVEQVAATNSTVLLIGETGTGKELIASAIHESSTRAARPMVRVNCAAIPESLIESELFGREKGAYTGALSRQVGRFEVAHGSTLFLDEVSELPSAVQVKLLRVLQEKQIERLGSPKSIAVDVRIIAATNRALETAVREGRFRDDLYYRLNVFPIKMPPLRERAEDIPELIQTFVNEFSKMFGKNIESIDRRSIDLLQLYKWPGNIRELRNTVERAVILVKGPKLHISPPSVTTSDPLISLTLDDVEREHLRSVLEMTGWRVRGKDGAAEILDLKPTTLESKMVRFGIGRKSDDKVH